MNSKAPYTSPYTPRVVSKEPYLLNYRACLTFHKAGMSPKSEYLETLSEFEHLRRRATIENLSRRMGTDKDNPMVYYLLYVSKICEDNPKLLLKLYPPGKCPKNWWQRIQKHPRLAHEIDKQTLCYYASRGSGDFWEGVTKGLSTAGFRLRPTWWAWFVWDYPNYPELPDYDLVVGKFNLGAPLLDRTKIA